MTKFKSTLLAAALFAAAPLAMAGSATAPLNVTLNLQNVCTISTAAVDFGNQTTLASDIDAAGSVTVTCTSTGGVYSVSFNGGSTAGGTIAQRKLINIASGNTINYNLYTTTGRTVLLGDGTTGVVVGGTGNGSGQLYQVFGRVPLGQNPKAVGAYSDVVTATVSF